MSKFTSVGAGHLASLRLDQLHRIPSWHCAFVTQDPAAAPYTLCLLKLMDLGPSRSLSLVQSWVTRPIRQPELGKRGGKSVSNLGVIPEMAAGSCVPAFADVYTGCTITPIYPHIAGTTKLQQAFLIR